MILDATPLARTPAVGAGLAPVGEVDFHRFPLFEVVLRRVWVLHGGHELRVVPRNPRAVVARIIELIGAPALRVEG